MRTVVTALLIPIIAGFGGSALFWATIQRGEIREGRKQSDALALQSDVRVSLSEFRREAPDEEAAYGEALRLWRNARDFVAQGKYAEARQAFRQAAHTLVMSCRECPGVMLTPG